MIIKCSLVNGRPLFSSYPFTRVYHARDCARSRHVPSHKLTAQLRNVSFSTGHNGTRGEANRARERRIRVCTYPTLTIRPRTHPAHPSNSLRTRDTGAPCVSRVLHGCVQPATCAPSSSSSSDLPPPRGEWVRIRTHIVDLHVPTRRVHHPIAISVELR